MKNLRPMLYKIYKGRLDIMKQTYSRPDSSRLIGEVAKRTGTSIQEAQRQLEIEFVEFASLEQGLRDCQTIAFSADQVEIFRGLSQSYTEGLDYTLPFPSLLLQFTRPLPVTDEQGKRDEVIAFHLSQHRFTQKQYEESRKFVEVGKKFGSELHVPTPKADNETLNNLIIIYSDYNVRKLGWFSQESTVLFEQSDNKLLTALWRDLKNVAIACIGYINCENVYLEETNVPEKLQKKLQRKGRETPEPYYICRVRGVSSPTHATGSGTKHGHRYDVRGHFRHYKTGVVKWIYPHQRGLSNDLYIPKTYLVKKGSKTLS